MVAPLYTTASGLLFHAGKILVLTIGLPARGKTHISRALERYLRWMGVKTQVVSLGDYRRKILGAGQKVPSDYFTLGDKSPETKELRKKVSTGCEQLIWDFFEGGGQVVIYDANNGSKATRQALAEKFDKAGIHVVLLEHSYKADSDLSPAGWEYAERLKDFLLERRAKSLKERGIDPSERKLVIWTSTRRRANHTAYPFLATAQMLNAVDGLPVASSPEPTSAISSMGQTTVAKASGSPLNVKVVEKPQMLEINPGIWDGLSPVQAKKYYPEDWARFMKDPYAFRAPRAESYHDLSVRLDPVLIELEKEQEDLLIVGHASVIRCMLAYLIGLPASEIPAIEIARGDLIEVVPASYGVHSQAFHFWDGPGRRGPADPDITDKDDINFYENYAEDTKGKRNLNTPEPSIIKG
ncbi:hypothetical protein C0995_003640 [Termitomyces sp. Mi166|nr:hypothetical protein C0995_003640 [Termitomyces sp. Mi166\